MKTKTFYGGNGLLKCLPLLLALLSFTQSEAKGSYEHPTTSIAFNETCPNNLLEDPSFNFGFSSGDWLNVDGGGSATDDAYSGTKAMKISGLERDRIIQTLDAVAGEEYLLTAFVKSTDPDKFSVTYLKFMDASYQPLDRFNAKINTYDYLELGLLATAPPGTAYVEVGLQKAAGSLSIFADDWCLQRTSDISAVVECGCYFENDFADVPLFGAAFVTSKFVEELPDASLDYTVISRSNAPGSSNNIYKINVSQIGELTDQQPLGTVPNSTTTITKVGWFNVGGLSTTDQYTIEYTGFDQSLIWENTFTFPGAISTKIADVKPVPSGGFVFSGHIIKLVNGEQEYYPHFFTTDETGNLLHMEIGERHEEQIAVTIELALADKFVFVISSQLGALGKTRQIIQTDANLNLDWTTNTSHDNVFVINAVVSDTENNLYVSSTKTFSANNNIRVTTLYKYDAEGTLLWEFTLSDNWDNPLSSQLLVQEDGIMSSTQGSNGIRLRKIGFDGELLHEEVLIGRFAKLMAAADDGSLVFGGAISESVPGAGVSIARFYTLRTSSSGKLIPPCEISILKPEFNLLSAKLNQIFPQNSPVPFEPIVENSELVIGSTISVYESSALVTYPFPAITFKYSVQVTLSRDEILSSNDINIFRQERNIIGPYDPVIDQLKEGALGTWRLPVNLQLGDYYIIIKYDALDELEETDETNNTIIIPVTVVPEENQQGDEVDVALSLQQSIDTPDQWSNYSVLATVSNTGDAKATGIKMAVPKADGIVYVGGNQFAVSQGSFDLFGNEVWTVGDLDPGSSATMTINYFNLSPEAPATYAQIVSQNEEDVDSVPNNGTPPIPNEDDEASTHTTSNPKADLTIENLRISFYAPEEFEIDFNFDVLNRGTVDVSGTGLETNVYLSTDNVLDNQDEFFVNIFNSPVSAGATIPANGGLIYENYPAGRYYLILHIDATNIIDESDETNNIISVPIDIIDILGGVVDLELSSTISTNIPERYENYSLSLQLTNFGSASATGVTVAVPLPDGVVYVGNDPYNSSQGELSTYGNSIWEVGNLTPGATATLNINYFLLSNLAIKHFAEVATCAEEDVDSTPGNGFCCTANEDDEIGLTTNTPLDKKIPENNYSFDQLQLFNIYPNPNLGDDLTLSIGSPIAQEKIIQIYDALGKEVHRGQFELKKGVNKIILDVKNLSSGSYRIWVPGERLKFMPSVFLISK